MSPFFLNLSLLGSARMLEFAPSSQKRGSWELISSTFRFWRKKTLRRFSISKKHLGPNEKNPVGSMPWSSCFDMLCGGLRYDPLLWLRKGCQHRKKKVPMGRFSWQLQTSILTGASQKWGWCWKQIITVGRWTLTNWWFQYIWKILVKVGIFPK